MMQRYAATLVALIALSCAIAPCVSLGAQSAADKLAADKLATDKLAAEQMVDNLTGSPAPRSNWGCETTQASGQHVWEHDTFEKIGDLWMHGASRPVRGAEQPFYDFYLGYAKSHWVYIQIAPAIETYFVALSNEATLDGSWRIVYPWELVGYTVRTPDYKVGTPLNSLVIQYPDLQQACQRLRPAPTPAPTPATRPATRPAALPASPTPTPAVLMCRTWYSPAGKLDEYGPTEMLTISTPQNGTSWRQGVAMIGKDRIYDYNLFDVKTETESWRISILVNGKTGVYAIAKSYKLKNLNNSAWVVQYPSVQPGFAFKDVTYRGDLPTGLTLIFRDGFQQCEVGYPAFHGLLVK
jgi:hypothetical protein